jgi:O-succinylbenzoic acid--CoA ligase
MSSLADWLIAGARHNPERMALLGRPRGWSYLELAEHASRGAAHLRYSGLLAGDIACISSNPRDLALAALSCSLAGIVLFPLDPALGERRSERLRGLAGERARQLPPLPLELPVRRIDWPEETETETDPERVTLIIATSGSEGDPKAVMLTHGNLDRAAAASNERLPLAPGDIWLACLPLHHIGGISPLFRCLRAGATLLLHEGFDANTVWADLQKYPVTHISLVPAMLSRLLDVADGTAQPLAPPLALRHALVGGAALSRTLFERARASGWPVCPTWGMSECAAQAATLVHPDSNWREGDVGKPLPGVECRVDADNRMHLRGPQVMAGYLNPQLQPGEGLEEGWLATNDLGRIEASGHITVMGRADDILISGGIKIHPLEIESCLGTCPGVSDVAVTAIADPVWGDILVALLVGTAEARVVAQWCRQHLASSRQPRRLLKIEHLPRNALGKLERNKLRSLAGKTASLA